MGTRGFGWTSDFELSLASTFEWAPKARSLCIFDSASAWVVEAPKFAPFPKYGYLNFRFKKLTNTSSNKKDIKTVKKFAKLPMKVSP